LGHHVLRRAVQKTGFQAASESDLIDKRFEKMNAGIEHATVNAWLKCGTVSCNKNINSPVDPKALQRVPVAKHHSTTKEAHMQENGRVLVALGNGDAKAKRLALPCSEEIAADERGAIRIH
jgi:hypothetical protein